MISNCQDKYSVSNQDQNAYDLNWLSFNQSIVVNSSYSNIYKAFQFTKSNQINSYPYSGIANTYFGGGYLFKMIGDAKSLIQSNLSILQKQNWINKQTAGIFIEFTLFNPNVNLFQYCSILFEILPTGSLLKSSQFNSIDIFDVNNSGLLSFKILMNIIYMIFIGIFMAVEIRQFIKMGRRYFLQFYNYIELVIIGFSWAAFAMYLYRLYSSYDIYKTINNKTSNLQSVYINLQYISNCDVLLNYFLGFCAAFGTFRFIKLLRFNKRIIVFLEAFKKSLKELIFYMLLFIVSWMAFVQMFYILLNNQYAEFASLDISMTTCFQMILGKNANLIMNSNAYFVSILYMLFAVFIMLVMINIFTCILNDNFALARVDKQLDIEDPQLFDYIKSLIISLF